MVAEKSGNKEQVEGSGQSSVELVKQVGNFAIILDEASVSVLDQDESIRIEHRHGYQKRSLICIYL